MPLTSARSLNAPAVPPAGGSSRAPLPADADAGAHARRNPRARSQADRARPDARRERLLHPVEVAQHGAPGRGRRARSRPAAPAIRAAHRSPAAEAAPLPEWVREGTVDGSCSAVRVTLAAAPGAAALRAGELDRLTGAIAVESDTGCWRWMRGRTAEGYGEIKFRGAVAYAHRLILALFQAQPRRKRLALHSCDHRYCVNPAHLRWGTHSENNHEAYARCRRTAPGQLAFEGVAG